MISAKNDTSNQYIQYDSNLERTLTLNLPKTDIYDLEVVSISLYFPNNYTPDPKVGYIVISNTQNNQFGSTTINGIFKNKQGGIVFPIHKLTSDEPECLAVNSVYFNPLETLTVTYYDGSTYKPRDMDRICILFHLSKKTEI